MKILWHSVAPWAPTGYGQQTATFVPRIKALGHDIAINAFYGLGGACLDWRGIKCFPNYHAAYGTDTIVPNALEWFDIDQGGSLREAASRGVIITLCDTWVLGAPLLPDMNVASWAPIDHLAVPGIVRQWFTQVGSIPIAMSRFGESALTDAGFNPLYVPHGIDTSVFKPGDQKEARERTGVPQDRFVVALVAANVGKDGNRKAFAEQISAFATLRKRHDDAFLIIHTDIASPVGSDVKRLLSELPDDSYLATDQAQYRRGIPPSGVADIYRSADILTNTAWGEGFGICIVEAQACGTPVVVTDATAMHELCGAGWRVGFEPLWHDSQEAWAAKPVIGEIVAAYEEAYDKAAGLRAQAADFGQMYDADFITDTYWVPALARIEEALELARIDAAKPRDTLNRPANVRVADGLLWFDRGPGTEDAMGPGGHEEVLQPVLESLLPDGGVFMDVGAHVGHWSLRLAAKAGKVIAVEANHDTAEILRRNVALNDLDDKITIHRFAAWDTLAAELVLHDGHDHLAGGSTTVMKPDKPRARGLGDGRTFGHRLDVVFADVDRVDLIKLDVEGADIHALEGMRDLLERTGATLFIERHDMYGYYTLTELEDELRSLGYRWVEVAEYFQSTYLMAVPDVE